MSTPERSEAYRSRPSIKPYARLVSAKDRAQSFSDPALFQSVWLGRKLWAIQRQIAIAAATKRETSVKGCHASGKTFVAAGAVLHHLTRYPSGKAITISPTLRQVKLFWREIETARAASMIAFPQCSTTGIEISEQRYGIGFSSSKGVNAQGFHGSDVLIITDESPGISGDVWDAIEGTRSGGCVRILKLGNPTVPSGPFFEDFTRGRGTTETITISAFDTPNLQNPVTGHPFTEQEILELPEEQLDIAPEPSLIGRRWVRERYLRWGPKNPRYVSRVLGQFPQQSEHACFSLAWIERAKRVPTEAELQRAQGCVIQAGIDVAGPGDDETAGCARVNGIVLKREAWPDKDPRGAVCRWLSSLRGLPYPLGPVMVDITGIGYNFALHLADQGFDVRGFVAGGSPLDPEQFLNAKAEAYFRLADMYRADYLSHSDDSTDEECEAQLSAVNYEETSTGKVKIESKEDARKRGVQSPDRAEAQVLAFARVVPRTQSGTYGEIVQISPI